MLTMHYYQKFAIIGFIISLVAIALGIVGLTTSNWISINHDESSPAIIYDLFRPHNKNNTSENADRNPFRTSQYVEIIGYIILVVGLFLGVLFAALFDRRSIHFIPPIIILIGTTTIFIGLIFYMKNLVESNYHSPIKTLNMGYSMILMISTSIIGCILIAYFSFIAGYIHRHILATVNIH
jgi:hypothetical protein